MNKQEPHACRDCYEVNGGFAVSDEGQKRCLLCNGVALSVTEMIDYIAYLKAIHGIGPEYDSLENL